MMAPLGPLKHSIQSLPHPSAQARTESKGGSEASATDSLLAYVSELFDCNHAPSLKSARPGIAQLDFIHPFLRSISELALLEKSHNNTPAIVFLPYW